MTTDQALAEVEKVLAEAVAASRRHEIRTVDGLLSRAIAIADASVTGDHNRAHSAMIHRMFNHRLAGWTPDYETNY